jgi:poly(3-hydroxybutyrate) depolymerase
MTLKTLIHVLAVAACVGIAAVAPNADAAQAPGAAQAVPAAPGTAAPAPGRGRGPQPVDPRVQIRMHHFAETNQEIPYSLFVSSKVKKNKKAPLIVTLHGIGGTHLTMMRPNAIDLAEAGGYILLAPMGYNPRGWYGAPAPQGRRRGAPPAPPVDSARGAASDGPTAGAAAAPPQGRRGALPPGLLSDPNDPPNLRELSERETLEVVDLIRKEFKVDDDRTYLMGHSMGGAGTLYLAIKYPAAVGCRRCARARRLRRRSGGSEQDSQDADHAGARRHGHGRARDGRTRVGRGDEIDPDEGLPVHRGARRRSRHRHRVASGGGLRVFRPALPMMNSSLR